MNRCLLIAVMTLVSLSGFFTASTLAGIDIDFDDGVLFIETDEHDDLIFLRPDGEKLSVHIFELEDDTFSYSSEFELLLFFESAPSMIEDYFDDEIIRDRRYRKDFDDVHTVVISSGDGEDGINFVDEDGVMPRMRVYVNAGAGNDFVRGNRHAFYLHGEEGDDKISTQDSSFSYINGGDGEDDLVHDSDTPSSIVGGNGDDYISCWGTGRIFAWGGKGCDRIYGGGGNDRIYGGEDDDRISGRDGDDQLFGGSGYDRVYGKAGNDYLEGGFDGELDRLRGGDGIDEAVTEYYRIVGGRFGNKGLIETLETEDFQTIEIETVRLK